MKALQVLLVAMFVAIALYTAAAVDLEGWTLFEVFMRDLASMTWRGQFDLDFACYLALSAVWIAWRHRFAGPWLAVAAFASVAGIVFFAPYVLVASVQARGDVKTLLLGPSRV